MAHRGGGRGRSKNRPMPYDRVDKGQHHQPPPGEFQIPKLQNTEGGPGGLPGEPGPQEGGGNMGPPPPPLQPPLPQLGTKKFSNKARLFFGNLPRDFTEQELRELLEAHGEVQEVYHNKEKNFAFARMAYRSEAEKVIAHHNGETIRNRDIKVRFAASSASVKVSNLNPTVSNELLAQAFSQFGEVEEAMVATDDRGKPLGYGVVDFARKGQALSAIQQCRNEPYLLTKTPVPVTVTEMVRDNEDGLPEKQLPKNTAYHFEREAPPRFPQPGSLEYDVAMRWKAFFEQEKAEREELEEKIKGMKGAIQKDMDTIREQHQTLMLRQEIARHQLEQQRLSQKLREQEDRLKGLNAAQSGMSGGLLPLYGGSPAPLFPPVGGGDAPRPEGQSGPNNEMQPPQFPPMMPSMGAPPLFMTPPPPPPPPLMGQ